MKYQYWSKDGTLLAVASFMGAWIEISSSNAVTPVSVASHPLWVRGLKFLELDLLTVSLFVASFMGAWIEILRGQDELDLPSVASFMGAWIEMFYIYSLLSILDVASFMGAWIEIRSSLTLLVNLFGRILYGCVD